MTDEENRLHMAALDALLNIKGAQDESALVALFRSDCEIHPMLRCHIADALENGLLRIHRGAGQSGKPRTTIQRVQANARAVEIGQFYLDRVAPCGNEKAALSDTCAEFQISEKTARKYRNRARAWNAARDEWRRSRGT